MATTKPNKELALCEVGDNTGPRGLGRRPREMIAQTRTASRCVRHPAVHTTIRCATCERPFCRDCVVTRFVTSRSSVWLCEPCAGVRRPHPSAVGGRSGRLTSPIIGAPRAGRGRFRPSGLWLAIGGAAVLTAAGYLQRMLPL